MAEIEITEEQRVEIIAAIKKYRNGKITLMKFLSIVGFGDDSGLVENHQVALFEVEGNTVDHALELVGVEEPEDDDPEPVDPRPKFTFELVERIRIATTVEVHADTEQEAMDKAFNEADADLDVAPGWEVNIEDSWIEKVKV